MYTCDTEWLKNNDVNSPLSGQQLSCRSRPAPLLLDVFGCVEHAWCDLYFMVFIPISPYSSEEQGPPPAEGLSILTKVTWCGVRQRIMRIKVHTIRQSALKGIRAFVLKVWKSTGFFSFAFRHGQTTPNSALFLYEARWDLDYHICCCNVTKIWTFSCQKNVFRYFQMIRQALGMKHSAVFSKSTQLILPKSLSFHEHFIYMTKLLWGHWW